MIINYWYQISIRFLIAKDVDMEFRHTEHFTSCTGVKSQTLETLCCNIFQQNNLITIKFISNFIGIHHSEELVSDHAIAFARVKPQYRHCARAKNILGEKYYIGDLHARDQIFF